MDYLVYSDKMRGASDLPTVTASPTSPKTAYIPHMDIVYVNTGSGWTPMFQPGSASVYSGYSSAATSTQAAILTSIANTSSAPGTAHTVVATKTVDTIMRGHA